MQAQAISEKTGTQVFNTLKPQEKKVDARDIIAMGPPSEASKEMPKQLQEGVKKASKAARKNHNRKQKKQKESKNQQVAAAVTPNLDTRLGFLHTIEKGKISQITSVEESYKLKNNPFNPKEKALLKEMFSRVHLDDTLTLMDILGFEICRCYKDISEIGCPLPEAKKSFLRYYFFFYGTLLMTGNNYISEENKIKNLKTKFFPSFEIFAKKMNQNQERIFLIHEKIKNDTRSEEGISPFEYLQDLYGLFARICTFKNPREMLVDKTLVVHEHSDLLNQGRKMDCLDDLITYMEFFHLAFEASEDSSYINPLKEVISAVKEIAQLTKDNRNSELGPKFLQLRHMLHKYVSYYKEQIGNWIGLGEDILNGEVTYEEFIEQMKLKNSDKLNQEEFYALVISKQGRLVIISSLLEDVNRIFEKRILAATYPSFLSESESIWQIERNAHTMLSEEFSIRNENLPKMDFDKTLDNDAGDLFKLLEQIRKEQKELYLTTMSLLPTVDISNHVTSLDEINLTSYTKAEELTPLLRLLEPSLKKLPDLLKELDNLRRKHLQQIQEVITKLNLTKLADKKRLVDALRKFYFKESKYICRYILVLKDAEKLGNFEEYMKKTLQGEAYLPTELIDYVLLDGIEELLSVPFQVEIEESENKEGFFIEEVEEEKEKAEDKKKEVDEKEITSRRKIKPIKAPIHAIPPPIRKIPKKVEKMEPTIEPFKIPRNLKMRKVLQLLREEGLFADKKMKGDHAKYREPESKKFAVVPVAKPKGLKAGTSHNLAKIVNAMRK